LIYNQPQPSFLPPYPLGINRQLIDFQVLRGGPGGGGGWGWNGPQQQLLPLLLQQQQQLQLQQQFLGNFYGTPGWGWPRPFLR